MNAEQELLITGNLSIVARVVGREMARGLMPWVDRSELESVANDALVTAALAFSGEGSFEAFAYKVVRNAVLMDLRALQTHNAGRDEMPEDVDRQPATGRDIEIYHALSILQGFSPRQYRAIVLFYFNGMSQIEVAAEMGVTRESVKDLLERAKKNLRKLTPKWESQTLTYTKGEKGR